MRGGPGDFAARERRARHLSGIDSALAPPLEFLAAVYAYQAERALDPGLTSLSADGEVPVDEIARAEEALRERAPAPQDDAFWHRVASAPIFELAACRATLPSRELWGRRVCPVCRGEPQVSVIDEESGEFMHGSPRFLICGRCATWWAFGRAVCARCGEHDPKNLASYLNDRWPYARIDACQTCSGYIKTFDLREPGAAGVIPLVDDVATIALDLWVRS